MGFLRAALLPLSLASCLSFAAGQTVKPPRGTDDDAAPARVTVRAPAGAPLPASCCRGLVEALGFREREREAAFVTWDQATLQCSHGRDATDIYLKEARRDANHVSVTGYETANHGRFQYRGSQGPATNGALSGPVLRWCPSIPAGRYLGQRSSGTCTKAFATCDDLHLPRDCSLYAPRSACEAVPDDNQMRSTCESIAGDPRAPEGKGSVFPLFFCDFQ